MSLWPLITRLGEAQILLPAAVSTTLLLARDPRSRSLAARWLMALTAATLITTASKVAYMGWGIGGSARWNFTGISGHAMFSSAIYPILLATLAGFVAGREQRQLAWLGVALAALVGYSRLVVHAHSPAEVIAGLAVGGLASWLTLRTRTPTDAGDTPWLHRPWWTVTVSVWLTAAILWAPEPSAHEMVQSFSRWLSGHPRTYTRQDLQTPVSLKPQLPRLPGRSTHPFS